MIWRLQGGTKNDETMTSAGIAGDRQVKTKSSDPCSEISGFDEVKLSDVTADIERPSRRSDTKMEDMEITMKQTHETVLQSVNAQINGINSTINETNEELKGSFGKMDERFAGSETILNKLEDPSR